MAIHQESFNYHDREAIPHTVLNSLLREFKHLGVQHKIQEWPEMPVVVKDDLGVGTILYNVDGEKGSAGFAVRADANLQPGDRINVTYQGEKMTLENHGGRLQVVKK